MANEGESEAVQALCPPGRIIVDYIHEAEEGATLHEIVSHIKRTYPNGVDDGDLKEAVNNILKNGAEMGFLDKKGSHYLSRKVREARGRTRRRQRSCSCRRRRRRRRIRRRYRSKRRRRCR